MTTTIELPIGIYATQVTIDSVTTTPTSILPSPVAAGKHFISVYDGANSAHVGYFNFTLTNFPISYDVSDTCYQTSVNDWNFNLDTASLTIAYDPDNYNFNISCSSGTISNIIIKEFVIPLTLTENENKLGIDKIQANLTATNSPVTFLSPLVQSSTGANAVNLGQVTVTQATDINTAVTANGSSGVITTVSATTTHGETDSFVVNNSTCTSTSVVVATLCGYTGTNLPPMVTVSSVGSGSFTVNITNINPSFSLDGVLKISFVCC